MATIAETTAAVKAHAAPIGRRLKAGACALRRRPARHRRPSIPAVQSPSFVAACGLIAALTAIAVIDPLVRLHPGLTAGSLADRILTALTSFGEGVEMLVGAALVVFAAAAVDPSRLGRRARAGLAEIAGTAAFAFVAIAGSGLIGSLIKNFYGRARPAHIGGEAVFELHTFAFRAKYASFPSGHSTTAGATAVVLALLFPRYARPILTAGVVVAVTRILLEAHFPADVIAGLTLGAVVTLALAHALARRGRVFGWGADGRLRLRPLAAPAAWFDTLAAVLADLKRTRAPVTPLRRDA